MELEPSDHLGAQDQRELPLSVSSRILVHAIPTGKGPVSRPFSSWNIPQLLVFRVLFASWDIPLFSLHHEYMKTFLPPPRAQTKMRSLPDSRLELLDMIVKTSVTAPQCLAALLRTAHLHFGLPGSGREHNKHTIWMSSDNRRVPGRYLNHTQPDMPLFPHKQVCYHFSQLCLSREEKRRPECLEVSRCMISTFYINSFEKTGCM